MHSGVVDEVGVIRILIVVIVGVMVWVLRRMKMWGGDFNGKGGKRGAEIGLRGDGAIVGAEGNGGVVSWP